MNSEIAELRKKHSSKIVSLQMAFQKELVRVEQAYLNKIEWYKEHEKTMKEEHRLKTERRVTILNENSRLEIDRLTVIINQYREKLNKREHENRNLLVKIQIKTQELAE